MMTGLCLLVGICSSADCVSDGYIAQGNVYTNSILNFTIRGDCSFFSGELRIGGLYIGFEDVAFLPSGASFCTRFLKNSDRG